MQKNRLLTGRRFRRQIRGAAMVETLLSYFLLFLILLGMLHVFYFFAGQLFSDYAAYRGARSRAVGFADYLVAREVRVCAIGGSGKIVRPTLHSSGLENSDYDATQFAMEKTLVQRYRMGFSWLEYQFWFPSDGDGEAASTWLDIKIKDLHRTSRVIASFIDYVFPLSAASEDENGVQNGRGIRLFFNKGIDLTGTAELGNHSTVYLKE